MSDHTPAIDQNVPLDKGGNRQFSCEWKGKTRTENFSGWSRLTLINRNTIKGRFYQGRTPRECLGIDKIVSKPRNTKPRTSNVQKERKQIEIAKHFLSARW